MATTRLQRKEKRNKLKARQRKTRLQHLTKRPVLKKKTAPTTATE